MANALYGLGRQAILSGAINWLTDTIVMSLISTQGVTTYGLQVSAATNAGPIQLTFTAAHGLSTGDQIIVSGVGGNTAANTPNTFPVTPWVVTVISSTVVTLNGSVGNGAFTSGGWAIKINKDQYFSDIPSGSVVATSSAIGSPTVALGVAGCADVTFTSVSGAACQAIVVWKNTGTNSTSPLIAYMDVETGLPVTPNGANIVFQIDRGVNKLFML